MAPVAALKRIGINFLGLTKKDNEVLLATLSYETLEENLSNFLLLATNFYKQEQQQKTYPNYEVH